MKYKEGQLLRFTPFNFKNGATPKRKYFIVLKQMDEMVVMASLPTSQNHIPRNIPLTSGCINLPERAVNAYIFMPKEPVTGNFSFTLPTFVYGEEVDEYNQTYLNKMDSNIENFGTIHNHIFIELKKCLKQSALLKRRFKRLL